MKSLPERTIERLSQYRRVLLGWSEKGNNHIYSHELANLLHITPVQVRRDIMLIGHNGTLRKGYDVKKLIKLIGEIIDSKEVQKVAIIGVGNLGMALMNYFQGKSNSLQIAAAFDVDPDKVDRMIVGVRCHHVNKLPEIIRSEKISIAVITTPEDQAAQTAETLVLSGVKGILNYTPTPVNVAPHAHLEEYDMITSLEKVAYFANRKNKA